MEIIIHVEKKKLDTDYMLAIAEYTKRLSPFCKLRLSVCKDFSKLFIQPGSVVFSVVPGSHTFSSESFAEMVEQEALSGHSRLEFVIGKLPDAAAFTYREFSLSRLSMSCDLTAVVLSEQLYRAYTILNHITYHK